MDVLTYMASFGALQGILLLVFITFRQRHPGNLPLALFLLVFSLRLATIPTWNYSVLASHPWFYPATSPLPFLFGPLLWWYAWSSGNNLQKKPPMLFLHFIPWIVETLAIIVSVYTIPRGEYYALMKSIFAGHPPNWLTIRNGLKVVSNVIYLILTGCIAFGKLSLSLPRFRRVWLRSLTVFPGVVLVFFGYVALFPEATRRLTGGSAAAFLILSTTMVALIYAVSFLLLIAPERNDRGRASLIMKNEPLCSDLECKRLVRQVNEQFNKGAFQDPDLTLKDLAVKLNVNSNRLSFAINTTCDSSFRTFLNSRRIDFFINRIRLEDHRKFSILDIAFDAGFSSKSTFNRVFKNTYGITPSKFAENPMQQIENIIGSGSGVKRDILL
jgi:AraC-like DNA-binding protein